MPLTKRTQILIGTGCLLFLAIVLAGGYFVRRHTAGIVQDCPHDVRKCSDLGHLYHRDSGKCFLKGESPEGVCGRNMVISPVSTCRIQGECECDYDNHERLLVYHAETDHCYFIYGQGPCDEGYVITLSRQNLTVTVTCKPDVCYEQKTNVFVSPRDSIIPFNKKCYSLYEKLDEPGCKGPLKFWKNQLNPSCSPPANYKSGSFSGSIASSCRPGSRLMARGFCSPSNGIIFGVPPEEED